MEKQMIKLENKIVFITGASSGFGEAIAKSFAAEGAHCILCARRSDKLKTLAESIVKKYGTKAYPVMLDVRNNHDVQSHIAALPPEWQKIDILVNNAGLSRGLDKIHEASIIDWDEMIDTNVKGLLYVSRAVIPGMVDRRCGHIINIGSIAGMDVYSAGNVYCATKHAVRALSTAMRIDLLGNNIRVTNIQPGMAETEFSKVRFHGDEDRAAQVYQNIMPLTAEDVADAVLYAVTRPAHVNISELTLTPINQASPAFVYRDDKKK
jgi:3-hydroxy acid dehydrogenase / malonic semialdehyde reductase